MLRPALGITLIVFLVFNVVVPQGAPPSPAAEFTRLLGLHDRQFNASLEPLFQQCV